MSRLRLGGARGVRNDAHSLAASFRSATKALRCASSAADSAAASASAAPSTRGTSDLHGNTDDAIDAIASINF